MHEATLEFSPCPFTGFIPRRQRRKDASFSPETPSVQAGKGKSIFIPRLPRDREMGVPVKLGAGMAGGGGGYRNRLNPMTGTEEEEDREIDGN